MLEGSDLQYIESDLLYDCGLLLGAVFLFDLWCGFDAVRLIHSLAATRPPAHVIFAKVAACSGQYRTESSNGFALSDEYAVPLRRKYVTACAFAAACSIDSTSLQRLAFRFHVTPRHNKRRKREH